VDPRAHLVAKENYWDGRQFFFFGGDGRGMWIFLGRFFFGNFYVLFLANYKNVYVKNLVFEEIKKIYEKK
jgi:hypothetical protein